MTKRISALAAVMFFISIASFGQTVIRVGAFPNITHAQAMVGKANGWFDKALGTNVKIQWTSFNAGPSAIEALFAGAIDMAYVGPNPTISGYVRSNGEALRVVAGSASGGVALIVRNDSGIQKPEDFHGKRVASPQLGNTQDVALRAWLKAHGLKTTDKGGDAQVVPLANPDQLTLFLKKQLDAAWAPEPWATRLIHEGNGRLFLDERDLWPQRQFVITNLIVSSKFLHEHPDVVKNWIRAHVELTGWINAHLPESKQLINQQIQKETGKALSPAVLDEAFGRLSVTYDPLESSLLTSAQSAFDAGFLGKQWNLDVDRKVGKGVFSVAYAGSHGIHLYDISNINNSPDGGEYLGDAHFANRLNLGYTNMNFRSDHGYSHMCNRCDTSQRSSGRRVSLPSYSQHRQCSAARCS